MEDEGQRRAHYELEKKLAGRIRSSAAENRKEVTLAAYRELYEKLPWHVSRNKTDDEVRFEEGYKASFLHPLLKPGFRVLELGCGSGRTIAGLAEKVREGIGIDATLVKSQTGLPANIRLLEDDVRDISLNEGDFDLIFSFHLLEHLHPDDLPMHLRSINRHLRKGGTLFILTPHAVTGPHDISRYFDDVATGFHLKEYTYAELTRALKEAGFVRLRSQIVPRKIFRLHPLLYRAGVRGVWLQRLAEIVVGWLPSRAMQRRVGRVARLTYMTMYAKKP